MSEEMTDVPAGQRTVADLDLKPALEAVLMVVDEPATEEHLAKILQRPKRQIGDALRELADDYTVQGRGFELRLIMRRLAFLQPPRVRGGGRGLRPGRPAGPAHPGRPGDAGGGRLPPAGQPQQGLGGPRSQL